MKSKTDKIVVKPAGTAPGTRKRLDDGRGMEAIAIGLAVATIWLTVFLIWSVRT